MRNVLLSRHRLGRPAAESVPRTEAASQHEGAAHPVLALGS